METRASKREIFAAWLIASLLVAPFCLNPVGESDLGWHLALGRVIAQTGHIPRTNLLTWTVPDFPWYATNWLYDLIVYRAVTAFGVGSTQSLTLLLLSAALLGVTVAAGEVNRRGQWLVPAIALLL